MSAVINVTSKGFAKRMATAVVRKYPLQYCGTISNWSKNIFPKDPQGAKMIKDGKFWIVDRSELSNSEILQKIKNVK